ncbi:MAG: 2,4-dihydroxyhept-2-ene-1,7-dioic acid aldolase [Betaproteobacteria bacterium]|nr:2,4-dihydroxyhept-2-ene-1,7-dioic acid aldolase [Betaproteobacteria bacterium]
MRENKVKTLWQEGKAVINGWLGIPSSIAAENMAQAGWDALTCDLQHGLVDYSTAVPMLQAISTSQATPLARVPWNEPGIIMKMLDAGAYGIICPMINSRAECEALVGAVRYAPEGYRSFGPTRALWYAGADYAKEANKHILAIAMIETKLALYIGPSDLGLSLGGIPKLDQTDPPIVDAIKTILKAAKKHGVHPGIHCGTTEYAKQAIAWGFDLVTIAADNALLNLAAKAAVADMRGSPLTPGSSGPY